MSRASDYSCDGLPDHEVPDLELMAFYRGRVGDELVNEQVAMFGSDAVLTSMRRAHRSHLAALALTPRELHQRAEMTESLMLELDVPQVGAMDGLATDVDRMQLLVQVVKGLLDKAITHDMMMSDAEEHSSLDEDE